MTWIRKIATLDRFSNFFLIDNELIFGNATAYHEQYLAKKFGLPPFFAKLFTRLFPRGAASYDTYNDNSLVIEMSKELEPYIPALSERWNLTPMDRPKWITNESHYKVDKEYIKQVIDDYLVHEELDTSTIEFIKKYLPEMSIESISRPMTH